MNKKYAEYAISKAVAELRERIRQTCINDVLPRGETLDDRITEWLQLELDQPVLQYFKHGEYAIIRITPRTSITVRAIV